MNRPAAASGSASPSKSLLPRPDQMLVDRTLPKPERRRRYTRYMLAVIAVDLFQTKGYANTTVAEIADAANVSERTFFRFYSGKEDVIFYDFPELIDALKERISSSDLTVSWRDLQEMLLVTTSSLEEPADFQLARVRLFHSEPALMSRYLMMTSALEDALTEFFAARRAPGSDSYRYSRIAASIVMSACRAAFAELAREGGTLTEHFQKVIDTLGTQFLQSGVFD